MSAKLTIRWETLSDLIADGLEDLAVAHWQEAESDRSTPLDLDFERARAFERSGALKIAAMRRDGVLVGYAECMIVGGLFYKSTRHCYVQAIYIEPIFRGLAAQLIHWIECRVGEGGPTKQYIAAKTNRQGDFYQWLGYTFEEAMFAKRVGASNEQRDSAATVSAA